MEKGIIIIGKAGSGKSKLANEVADKFPKEQVKHLDGRLFFRNESFPYQCCDEKTKVLVFEDVQNHDAFMQIFSIQASGILTANKMNMATPLVIELDQIIVTCDEWITKAHLSSIGASFTRRFEIVEL